MFSETCLHFTTLLFGANIHSASSPQLWQKISEDLSCRLYFFLRTRGIMKHLVFIQHTERYHLFCVSFSTFQHLASRLTWWICTTPCCTAERLLFSSLATALALISLALCFLFHFALLFLECESWWLIFLLFCHLSNLSACLISR